MPQRRRPSSGLLLLLGLLLTNALVYVWGVALQPPADAGGPGAAPPPSAASLALLTDAPPAQGAPADAAVPPEEAARQNPPATGTRNPVAGQAASADAGIPEEAVAATADPRGLAACLIWGPYSERDPLDAALDELGPFLRTHEIREAEVNDDPDYLVFIGARGSRSRARQILSELKSQDIDSALIRMDEVDNAISVGVFSQPRRAERQRRRVAELGYEVEVRELTRTHQVFQLIGWPRGDAAQLPRSPDGYCDNIAQGSGFL